MNASLTATRAAAMRRRKRKLDAKAKGKGKGDAKEARAKAIKLAPAREGHSSLVVPTHFQGCNRQVTLGSDQVEARGFIF